MEPVIIHDWTAVRNTFMILQVIQRGKERARKRSSERTGKAQKEKVLKSGLDTCQERIGSTTLPGI